MSGNFLSCNKVVKDLSMLKREGGVSHEMPHEKRALTPVKRNISGFFLSCGRKLGVPPKL